MMDGARRGSWIAARRRRHVPCPGAEHLDTVVEEARTIVATKRLHAALTEARPRSWTSRRRRHTPPFVRGGERCVAGVSRVLRHVGVRRSVQRVRRSVRTTITRRAHPGAAAGALRVRADQRASAGIATEVGGRLRRVRRGASQRACLAARDVLPSSRQGAALEDLVAGVVGVVALLAELRRGHRREARLTRDGSARRRIGRERCGRRPRRGATRREAERFARRARGHPSSSREEPEHCMEYVFRPHCRCFPCRARCPTTCTAAAAVGRTS